MNTDIDELYVNIEPDEEINIEMNDDEEINVDISGEVISVGDYEILSNKPQINDVELIGNKTLDELGIQEEGNYPDTRVTNLEIDNLF